jgi:hypothetical protein
MAWLIPLLLWGGPAAAQDVDTLCRALLTDRSFRVRVQAALTLEKLRDPRSRGPLVEALRDGNEAVRAVAAGALGKLGDPAALDPLRAVAGDTSPMVRTAVAKAIAALEPPPAQGRAATREPRRSDTIAGRRVFIAVSPFSGGKGGADAARLLHDHVAGELSGVPGITFAPSEAAAERYVVDGSITNLISVRAQGKVRTDCDVLLVLATYPKRAIKMSATLGGSLEGTADPRDIAEARSECLEDLAKQAAERVQQFLAQGRPR